MFRAENQIGPLAWRCNDLMATQDDFTRGSAANRAEKAGLALAGKDRDELSRGMNVTATEVAT